MLEKKYTEKTFTLEILYHVGVYENSIHFIFDHASKTWPPAVCPGVLMTLEFVVPKHIVSPSLTVCILLLKFVIIKITCKHSELIGQANQITAFHLVDIPLVLQNNTYLVKPV
jgi:hypothetical protein